MKKVRRSMAAVLVGTMTLVLTACSSGGGKQEPAPTAKSGPQETAASAGSGQQETVPAEAKSDIRIGLILPIGGLGDNSIGDESYNGVKKAAATLGFEFDYSEPVNAQDQEAMISEYSEAKEYDLIIAVGGETLSLVEEAQPTYPDQKYLVYDTKGAIPNTMTEWFNKTEIGFMAGVFVALMDPYGEVTINGETRTWTPSGKYGLIIGNEFPSTVTAMTGAAAGTKYINPDSKYMYGIVGSWTDQAKNKELALSMYNEGCNFVFHNAGAGSAGILSAAEEKNLFMIGYDKNQNNMSATNIMASSHKNNVDVMVRVLTEFCESGGELNWGGDEENNYKNGGATFTLNDGVEIPEEVKKTMADIQNKLTNGEITVPSTWDEVEAFTAAYQ